MCYCITGYTGDPFGQCSVVRQDYPIEVSTPCSPSPCGSNAVCREQNGAGACTCISDYIGNPYEGCRPECVLNSDCASSLACIRNKCKDPCPGTCGHNAICQVVNHLPSCSCLSGYNGDPYRQCNFKQEDRKISLLNLHTNHIILLTLHTTSIITNAIHFIHTRYFIIQLLCLNMSILVNPHHVVQTLSAKKSTIKLSALVCRLTLEVLLVVDQNVL
jgi:hypothetical protein